MAQGSKKFSIAEILMLVGVACMFELVSLVPGLNIIINIVQWSFLFTVFHFKGVSYIKNKNILATSGIAIVIGFIPVLSILPEFLVALALNIHKVNKNADKKSHSAKVAEASRPSRINRVTDEEDIIEYIEEPQQKTFSVGQTFQSEDGYQSTRLGRSIQYARNTPSYSSNTNQSFQQTNPVLSASGAMLKNEQRNTQ